MEFSFAGSRQSPERSCNWESALLSLVHRSHCVLKTLTLEIENASDQLSIAELLAATPKLELFSLEYYYPEDHLLWRCGRVVEALDVASATSSRSGPSLVPEPETLRLTNA